MTQGSSVPVWTAGEKPLRLDVDPGAFADIVREAANDVRFSGHPDAQRLADALDVVADRAGKMAAEHGGTMTVSLTGDRLDLGGLKQALMSSAPTADHAEPQAAMRL